MAVPPIVIKAALTAATDKRFWKVVAIIITAILMPIILFILMIACYLTRKQGKIKKGERKRKKQLVSVTNGVREPFVCVSARQKIKGVSGAVVKRFGRFFPFYLENEIRKMFYFKSV